MVVDALSVVISLLALSACILSIPPLVAHVKARNLAAIILTLGIAILNLQSFVNALLWAPENFENPWDGKILCDIEVKLYIGISGAVNGAIASIFRQICTILDTDNMTMTPSPSQVRRRLIVEICLCVVVPLFLMAMHYVVQPGRYRVKPLSGCGPSFDNSFVASITIFLWPLIACLLGSTYCAISILRLRRHRKQMSSILPNAPGATKSRFMRLFAMALTLLVAYGPMAILAFCKNTIVPQHDYSWSHVHPTDWSKRIVIMQTGGVGFDRGTQIGTGYVFFLFFGLGQEANQVYKSWLQQLKGIFVNCSMRRGAPPGPSTRKADAGQGPSNLTIEEQLHVATPYENFHLQELRPQLDNPTVARTEA